jgi:hypothetical protein
MMVSSVLSFLLLVFESFIVMKWKGMASIDFGGITPFVNVWAMNFFFVFTIITHIYLWYRGKYEEESFD